MLICVLFLLCGFINGIVLSVVAAAPNSADKREFTVYIVYLNLLFLRVYIHFENRLPWNNLSLENMSLEKTIEYLLIFLFKKLVTNKKKNLFFFSKFYLGLEKHPEKCMYVYLHQAEDNFFDSLYNFFLWRN